MTIFPYIAVDEQGGVAPPEVDGGDVAEGGGDDDPVRIEPFEGHGWDRAFRSRG